ncbi:MAG: SpoIID/LytB domain-containing protein [Calditrichaeota bacterium]|nr:SpoIID/LytB domain-containing protein [Calditrichota bacterium]
MIFIYLLICSVLFSLNNLPNKLFSEEPFLRTKILETNSEILFQLNKNWILNGIKVTSSDSIFRLTRNENTILLYKADQKILTANDSLVFISNDDSATITIKDVPYGVGWWWEGKEDRIYEGKLCIYTNAQQMQIVVKLPLEQYLKGVIPYEIGNDAPLEALKAQAVAARSEAIMALTSGMYGADYYDLTADVECQVFSGNKKRNKMTDLAVDLTRSIILTENNHPINAYYASNCGGHSEIIQNVWPDRPDPETYSFAGADNEKKMNMNLSSEDKVREWILSDPDVFCNPKLNKNLPSWSKTNFRWTKSFSVDSISAILSNGVDNGLLRNIQVKKRGLSGRIIDARFIFEKDSFDVKGELNIRQLWQPSLRSACFFVKQDSNFFILKGAGWGHGVGMCQSGAITMAFNGNTFKSIIEHYYPGTDLTAIYPVQK